MNTFTKIAAIASAVIFIVAGFLFVIFNSQFDLELVKEVNETSKGLNPATVDVEIIKNDLLKIQNELGQMVNFKTYEFNENEKMINETAVKAKNDVIDAKISLENSQRYLEGLKIILDQTNKKADKKLSELQNDSEVDPKPDENKPVEPEPIDPKPDETKPEDPKPDETKPDKPKTTEADKVLLRKPEYLPQNYQWPLIQNQKVTMQNNLVSNNKAMIDYFKKSVGEKGNFTSLNSKQEPYFYMGKSSLGYAIIKISKDEGRAKVLDNFSAIRANTKIQNALTPEIAYLIIGIISSNLNSQTALSNKLPWEPMQYEFKAVLSSDELRMLRWGLAELTKRQTAEGGWSNFALTDPDLYDNDVFSTALAIMALSDVLHAGLVNEISLDVLHKGVEFLISEQNKGDKKGTVVLLDKNNVKFQDAKVRGWGYTSGALADLRTTVFVTAAIAKVLALTDAKNEDFTKFQGKTNLSILDGLAFVYENWKMKNDPQLHWGLLQLATSLGLTNLGEIDVFSELMMFYADSNQKTGIKDYSFINRSFAFFTINWAAQKYESPLKPLEIKGYAKS